VQSSSITTSTIIPLAGAGVLTLRQIYPFTLGANIGTTVTALLASLTLNVTAMVAAFSHLFFNIFGIVIIYLNPLLRNIPIKLAEWIANVALKNKAATNHLFTNNIFWNTTNNYYSRELNYVNIYRSIKCVA